MCRLFPPRNNIYAGCSFVGTISFVSIASIPALPASVVEGVWGIFLEKDETYLL